MEQWSHELNHFDNPRAATLVFHLVEQFFGDAFIVCRHQYLPKCCVFAAQLTHRKLARY